MKLSKLCLYLGVALLGLFSFAPSGCCSDGPVDGGLNDFSNPKAPKVIHSDNIKEFRLRFTHEGGIAVASDEDALPSFPAGNYLLEAILKGDTAHFMLSCDRQGTTTPLIFQKDLPVEALLDLQGIIRKYNLPAINGSSLRNSALGTSLSFDVLYDTDERLSVYAEGGVSTLPQRTADNPFGELVVKQVIVPKEKLEAIETIIAKYHMRDWKDLPYRENLEGNTDFISIVFNCSDGNNICLDRDQELPPEYKEAFEAVHQALTDAEKAVLTQLKK